MHFKMTGSVKSVTSSLACLALAVHAFGLGMATRALAFTAYISNEKGSSISIIDTDKLQVTKTVPVGHRPRGIVLNKDGSELYICAGDDDLIQILRYRQDNFHHRHFAVGTGSLSRRS